MTLLDPSLLDLLQRVDTPSVCNAIELAQGRRGFAAFTRGTLLAAGPGLPAIVGFAKTARIRAREPSKEDKETLRERRMAYYAYMADAPRPALAVIEDLDDPDCVGAFWGEINATVHKAFGISGALTNGVMRDLGSLPPDFQILAGSIGPSHAFVHVIDYGGPVKVSGLEVKPGDLIHADRHGAIVIPPDLVPTLSSAIGRMQASERLVLEPARQAGFTLEKFEAAWRAFEQSRV